VSCPKLSRMIKWRCTIAAGARNYPLWSVRLAGSYA
jgi:hypothetical protein